jgi:hypothetical protein
MDNNTANYNYSLSTQQRGKIYITQSDPRNTAIGRARLSAKYGEGNVIVIPDELLTQILGAAGSALESYSQESYSLIGGGATGDLTTATPQASNGLYNINPPTNVGVDSTNITSITNADGTISISIPVVYDSLSSYTYEVTTVSTGVSSNLQVPNNIQITSGTSRNIAVTWATVSNANNYVIYATLNGSTTPTYAAAPVSTTNGTIVVTTPGNYTVTVVPYNSNGIAGSAGTSNQFTVV